MTIVTTTRTKSIMVFDAMRFDFVSSSVPKLQMNYF